MKCAATWLASYEPARPRLKKDRATARVRQHSNGRQTHRTSL
jgi:hypothetical protein